MQAEDGMAGGATPPPSPPPPYIAPSPPISSPSPAGFRGRTHIPDRLKSVTRTAFRLPPAPPGETTAPLDVVAHVPPIPIIPEVVAIAVAPSPMTFCCANDDALDRAAVT